MVNVVGHDRYAMWWDCNRCGKWRRMAILTTGFAVCPDCVTEREMERWRQGRHPVVGA